MGVRLYGLAGLYHPSFPVEAYAAAIERVKELDLDEIVGELIII